MAKPSKRLVIDADIARACSENATSGAAIQCYLFLDSVLSISHRAVFTPEIEEQWDTHQSRYALRWRAEMDSRRKLVNLPSPSKKEFREFKAIVRKACQNDDEGGKMVNDLPLVLAAGRADKIIASMDTHARNCFARASGSVTIWREIIWVNPNDDGEKVTIWLENGADNDKERQLAYYAEHLFHS